MVLLCVICSWHAFISVIDNIGLYLTFDGYITSTLDAYNSELNKTNSSNEFTIYKDTATNQTMIVRNVLSIAERWDRYALVFFAVTYVIFHIVFVLWMYFSVSYCLIST
jgi:hypothetical protein